MGRHNKQRPTPWGCARKTFENNEFKKKFTKILKKLNWEDNKLKAD